MGSDDSKVHIARISYGKDSLKMLEVIRSRGLPLDRITTTDVWATDTISANLPPMAAFKERMDQKIWDLYGIEVEHLCAVNPDGSKRTYEQMFYHVPVRKGSQSVQVEREREPVQAGNDPWIPRPVEPLVSVRPQAGRRCPPYGGCRGILPDSHRIPGTTGVRNSRPNGFPAQISPWCRKLKIDKVRTPFLMAPGRGAGKEISWNILGSRRMSQPGSGS